MAFVDCCIYWSQSIIHILQELYINLGGRISITFNFNTGIVIVLLFYCRVKHIVSIIVACDYYCGVRLQNIIHLLQDLYNILQGRMSIKIVLGVVIITTQPLYCCIVLIEPRSSDNANTLGRKS